MRGETDCQNFKGILEIPGLAQDQIECRNLTLLTIVQCINGVLLKRYYFCPSSSTQDWPFWRQKPTQKCKHSTSFILKRTTLKTGLSLSQSWPQVELKGDHFLPRLNILSSASSKVPRVRTLRVCLECRCFLSVKRPVSGKPHLMPGLPPRILGGSPSHVRLDPLAW